jgi:hypothetical protein
MKTKQILAGFTLLSCLLFASVCHATWITALSGGSWGDPTIWDSGTVPGTNDFAEVDSPYVVTVDTNAIVQYIMGSGTVTMAAGSILYLMDPAGANGTYQLADLDTSAPSNTVVFLNNPFWAKHQNYCNLVFSNMVTTNLIDFYSGFVSTIDPAAAMTISGDMTVVGKIKVQQGADFTILGNLIMGTNSQWDCSSFNLTVVSNTYMGGLLLDLDAASGADDFQGNLTIASTALGWNVSDVTNWVVGGSLTNQALIVGAGYGRINFNGAGTIAGKPFTLPTVNINGSYTIGTTITLTTNNPALNGTVTFDIAKTNEIILKPSTGTNTVTTATNYYGGNLIVVNSGAPPASGASFKFFSAKNYAGLFTNITFPLLPAGLNWADNLLASGSIAVTGSGGGPIISLLQSAGMLTLSWDSTTYPGYRVQAQTNTSGIGTSWGNTSSGTVSPYIVTMTPTNQPVFFRLINP